MAKKTKRSITITVFILLFILNVFLQMLLSGEPLATYIVGVFTSLTGIVTLISATANWFISYFFTSIIFYILGIVVALEFLILPLLVRYGYITIKPDIFMSVLGALYVWLFFRILGVVFG
ncbi:hypothetical protein QLX67_07990 [Balneolaceae bacterium ANBcel3]|nr:hypothetical protein [Balneolaceae bacterium ANBcel3]